MPRKKMAPPLINGTFLIGHIFQDLCLQDEFECLVLNQHLKMMVEKEVSISKLKGFLFLSLYSLHFKVWEIENQKIRI